MSALRGILFFISLIAGAACTHSEPKAEVPIQISIEIGDEITFTSENVSGENIILLLSERSVSRPEDGYKFPGHLMFKFKDCEGKIIDVGFGADWWSELSFESQIYPAAEEIFTKSEIRTVSAAKQGAWGADHACEGKYQLSFHLKDGQIISEETNWIQFSGMKASQ